MDNLNLQPFMGGLSHYMEMWLYLTGTVVAMVVVVA